MLNDDETNGFVCIIALADGQHTVPNFLHWLIAM
jgi:hypothetical protein